MKGCNSEVARLMEQIDREYRSAKLGLYGLAITARHDFINARMENMGQLHQELKQLVGEYEATKLVVEVLESTA